MKSIKAIFRRGQNTKLDGQNIGDNLSRTSSITNLDADTKSNKGAKPKKSSSRDRLDKLGDRKNDKKGECIFLWFQLKIISYCMFLSWFMV